ncbi:MAG: alpha-L-fucosidase [Acidobacteria bacterium]|nr:MAG: alpha-L-fucosidase [Acidobacteriota bacterium]
MTYEPTWESVSEHEVPQWYDDAKLGVFLHWGLYSVPGWAPQVGNIQELLKAKGPAYMLSHNPYAEWYLNTMQIEGSPTQLHHSETYGADFEYDNFVGQFNEGANSADLDGLASLCKDAGAGYVVLTTKHHEGFCLWPASIEHPVKGRYHAERDLVGDFSEAVRSQGMRMGLYYSGGYDWPYNGALIRAAADTALAVPGSQAYADYAAAHVAELIDKYQPSVLWNDICWPPAGDVPALFAHYYNTVDEGVINDRWIQSKMPRNIATEAIAKGVGGLIQRLWRFVPESAKNLTFPNANHFDFSTPEYAVFHEIKEKKWEATRGVGHSFGANRNERPQDIVTVTELVRTFVDVVSKNGNLLIGIGPGPDGSIPLQQQVPLRGLGEWMSVNSSAVLGSRPWEVAEGETTQGTPVRFLRSGDDLCVALLETPSARTLEIRDLAVSEVTEVEMLGLDEPIEWSVDDGRLLVELPERLQLSPAHVLRISPSRGVRPLGEVAGNQ